MKINPSFFEEDDDLRIFLDSGAPEILSGIKNMREHRRAITLADQDLKRLVKKEGSDFLERYNKREVILLREDWDYTPIIDRASGHRVTRKREHTLLVNFLYQTSRGALLLGGRRGVGKTSAIFSAIQEVIHWIKK